MGEWTELQEGIKAGLSKKLPRRNECAGASSLLCSWGTFAPAGIIENPIFLAFSHRTPTLVGTCHLITDPLHDAHLYQSSDFNYVSGTTKLKPLDSNFSFELACCRGSICCMAMYIAIRHTWVLLIYDQTIPLCTWKFAITPGRHWDRALFSVFSVLYSHCLESTRQSAVRWMISVSASPVHTHLSSPPMFCLWRRYLRTFS